MSTLAQVDEVGITYLFFLHTHRLESQGCTLDLDKIMLHNFNSVKGTIIIRREKSKCLALTACVRRSHNVALLLLEQPFRL